jgi:hypothetical protein
VNQQNRNDARAASELCASPNSEAVVIASSNNGSIGATAPPIASSRTVAPVCPSRRGKSSPMDTSGVNPQRQYSFEELSCIEVSCTGPRRCGAALIHHNAQQHCPKCDGPVKVVRAMWRSVRWSFRQRLLYEQTGGKRGMYVQPVGGTTVRGEWFLHAVFASRSNSKKNPAKQRQQYRRNLQCKLNRGQRVQA